MNFAGSVKGRILFVFSMTNQRKMFISLVRKEKSSNNKKATLILSEHSERLETVCQVKLVPLQGNAVLGTNSIPVFSPVGIMPLYLQTCHGNVQEGLKRLRNALPGYIFYYLKASISFYSTTEMQTSGGLWITWFSVQLTWYESLSYNFSEINNKCKICSHWNILELIQGLLSTYFCTWLSCWSQLSF